MTKEIKIESNVPMNGVGQHNSYRKYSVLFETFDKMDVSQFGSLLEQFHYSRSNPLHDQCENC